MKQIDFSIFNKRFEYKTKFPEKSFGEIDVMIFLEEHNIKYIDEYSITFQSYNMRVDFYLPDFNTMIEYNGIQHYKPVYKFGGVTAFRNQQRRDVNLRTYCKQNNIKLIEIPYNHYVYNFLCENLNIK
jgi:hypothetical protein